MTIEDYFDPYDWDLFENELDTDFDNEYEDGPSAVTCKHCKAVCYWHSVKGQWRLSDSSTHYKRHDCNPFTPVTRG